MQNKENIGMMSKSERVQDFRKDYQMLCECPDYQLNSKVKKKECILNVLLMAKSFKLSELHRKDLQCAGL